MEFLYLSDITGNDIYRQKVDHIRQFVRSLDRPNGLYPNFLNPITGKWGQRKCFYIIFKLFLIITIWLDENKSTDIYLNILILSKKVIYI